MYILFDITDGIEAIGVFSIYSGMYKYAKAYAENRYEEKVFEVDKYEDRLSFVGRDTNVMTKFHIKQAPFQPTINKK